MMDENFIKMCREAKEIQEGWEPKPADKVVLVKLEDNPYNIKGDYHLDHLDKDAKEWSNEDLHKTGIYWLPRQEDLQAMIIDNNPEFVNVDRLLDDFMAGWNAYTGVYKTLGMLWLGFIMEYIFGKKWNGTTWEVIE